ncbi:MAG: hypothetical protein DRG83_00070 [Deltaproteobacteria bacterium]|nr:MAG: hypothetical protein DRG83_00070 [Deltaproteobacteria bacterium]
MATWDKNTPAGNDPIRLGDDEIRNMKDYLEDALSREHTFPGTYGSDAGKHLPGRIGVIFVGSTSQIESLPSPPEGALAYDTLTRDLKRYNGSSWEVLNINADTVDGAHAGTFLRRDGGNSPYTHINWGGYRITNLGNPQDSKDAANKWYVDNHPFQVKQQHLYTFWGTVSAGSTAQTLTLPGGEYGFYPLIRMSAEYTTYWQATILWPAWIDSDGFGHVESFKGWVELAAKIRLCAPTGTIYAYQRYVTSSGEVYWIFLLRDKNTGEILAGYSAPDHPCFGNGNDPILTPHPFHDYNPEKHEIVVINPTPEQLQEMRSLCRPRRIGQPKRCFLDLFHGWEEEGKKVGPFYEPDDKQELAYPKREITVGVVDDEDEKPLWWKKEAKIIKVSIDKYQPEYVKVRPLKRINYTVLR